MAVRITVVARDIQHAIDMLESEKEEGLQLEIDKSEPGETVYCYHDQIEVEIQE